MHIRHLSAVTTRLLRARATKRSRPRNRAWRCRRQAIVGPPCIAERTTEWKARAKERSGKKRPREDGGRSNEKRKNRDLFDFIPQDLTRPHALRLHFLSALTAMTDSSSSNDALKGRLPPLEPPAAPLEPPKPPVRFLPSLSPPRPRLASVPSTSSLIHIYYHIFLYF